MTSNMTNADAHSNTATAQQRNRRPNVGPSIFTPSGSTSTSPKCKSKVNNPIVNAMAWSDDIHIVNLHDFQHSDNKINKSNNQTSKTSTTLPSNCVDGVDNSDGKSTNNKNSNQDHTKQPDHENMSQSAVKSTTKNSGGVHESHKRRIGVDSDSLEVKIRYLACCVAHKVIVYGIILPIEVESYLSSFTTAYKQSGQQGQTQQRQYSTDQFLEIQNYYDEDQNEAYYTCAFGGRSLPIHRKFKNEGICDKNKHRNKRLKLEDGVYADTTNFGYFGAQHQPQLLCVAGACRTIKVIDMVQEKILLKLSGHGGDIYEMKFSPTDEWLLLSASKDLSLRLWNVKSATCVAIFQGHDGHEAPVLSISWHCTGTRIASSGMDNKIKLWKLAGDETGDAREGKRNADANDYANSTGRKIEEAIKESHKINLVLKQPKREQRPKERQKLLLLQQQQQKVQQPNPQLNQQQEHKQEHTLEHKHKHQRQQELKQQQKQQLQQEALKQQQHEQQQKQKEQRVQRQHKQKQQLEREELLQQPQQKLHDEQHEDQHQEKPWQQQQQQQQRQQQQQEQKALPKQQQNQLQKELKLKMQKRPQQQQQREPQPEKEQKQEQEQKDQIAEKPQVQLQQEQKPKPDSIQSEQQQKIVQNQQHRPQKENEKELEQERQPQKEQVPQKQTLKVQKCKLNRPKNHQKYGKHRKQHQPRLLPPSPRHKSENSKKSFGNEILLLEPNRYMKPVICQFPYFSTGKIHPQYVDCVEFVGELLLSKSPSAKPQESKDIVVLWMPAADPNDRIKYPAPSKVVALRTFQVPDGGIWFIRFGTDPDKRLLATGNLNGEVLVWDIGQKARTCMTRLRTYGDNNTVGINNSSGNNGSAKNGNRRSASMTTRAVSTVRQVSFSPDGLVLAACCDNGMVHKWDVRLPKCYNG